MHCTVMAQDEEKKSVKKIMDCREKGMFRTRTQR